MGHESKFIIAERSQLPKERKGKAKGLRFAQVITIFNMNVLGYDSNTLKLVNKSNKTDYFVYADDSKTPIVKDKYDDPLNEIEYYALIKALRKDDNGYRRIMPVINYLENLPPAKWKDLLILHYGY